MEIPINLVYEDNLSLEILLKLFQSPGVTSGVKRFCIGRQLHGRGYGYIKNNIVGFNEASKGMPYLILTDLDQRKCAPSMIREWLPVSRNHNLIFRIAVKEVESWVLADREGFAGFLGIAQNKVPENPDELDDPKAHLIQLAKSSRKRAMREDLVPKAGSTARQGPAYNERLAMFVREYWNPEAARIASPSLEKTLKSLEEFTPQWDN